MLLQEFLSKNLLYSFDELILFPELVSEIVSILNAANYLSSQSTGVDRRFRLALFLFQQNHNCKEDGFGQGTAKNLLDAKHELLAQSLIELNQPTQDDPTTIPEPGLDLIIEFGTARLKAYPDLVNHGLHKIGYGSCKMPDGIAVEQNDTITQDEAIALLEADITQDYLPKLLEIPNWRSLNVNQRGALLSFAYDVGADFYGSPRFKAISQVLASQQYTALAQVLPLYCNQKTKLRRMREVQLFFLPV